MREISTQTIVDAVKDASIRANLELGEDVVQALESALEYEESNVGKDILQKLLENAKIAREERIPM
ncbi:MAG: fumarate hydratase, partial [Desulfobacteraceae bacterium]|nr:fumarate hydratase [Desulfobacteraceae bacterium]